MSSQASTVEEVLRRYPKNQSSLIMVLQDVQAALSHVPKEAIDLISEHLHVPRSRVHSTASFYKSFSTEPLGKHRVDVCMGTACHVRGAERLVNQLGDELGIKPGETTKDLDVTLNTVHCVGACALGPVVIMDEEYHGEMTPGRVAKALKKCRSGPGRTGKGHEGPCAACKAAEQETDPAFSSPEELSAFREELKKTISADAAVVSICAGSGCRALGSGALIEAFDEGLKEAGLDEEVRVLRNGCHGFCEQGLIVVIRPAGIFYHKVKPQDVPEIIERTLKNDEMIERLLYEDPGTKEKIALEKDIPFYARQERLLMRMNGRIDPLKIEDYIANDGYDAMAKALYEMEPQAVVDEVKKAGLRGRGGGGFHAARKWASCSRVKADVKYVLCNADEGDPGAFMDCSLLEGNPHSVIEGMIIGAYAIAGREAWPEGYVYVRNEYPMAVANLDVALGQARARGLLGENILGSGFSYDIKVSRGGGSFVCGESTALMASIEGKIGEPRAKYIHTSTSGLYQKPTVLNNVETWANVPLIIRGGAERFAELGTEKSKGTKIFSLVGKVNNTGLVEVPMGITLREVVFGIGGGIRDNKKFKAVQTGGPSGGCVPESLLDIPVDFEELTKAGSMMGSGGMIVMDESTCMVDVARYFTGFLTEESCGKCAACRMGLDQLKEVLERICAGQGKPEDIPRMEQLFKVLDDGSLCGLGKSASNPVRSTLQFFREEYEAHIFNKKCPAGVCRSLITFAIDDSCTGCLLCKKACPKEAISGEKEKLHVIDEAMCDRCGICVTTCKFGSIVTV